jgi:iron-sulfur cluster insertion protein
VANHLEYKIMNNITFTNAVIAKLHELIAEEGNPDLKLRIFVQGGGCSGFSYGFTFDDLVNEDDFTFCQDNITIAVDAMSMQYLQDATLDFKDDLQGSSFVINNPQAESTCGCGSSFSMGDDFGQDYDDFGHGY